MLVSELIRKLETEQAKYGDIEVIIHAPIKANAPVLDSTGEFIRESVKPKSIEDVATFATIYTRAVWISSEPAE